MNREIKFRGQRIDTKEWVYGGFYEWNNKTYIVQKDIWDMQNFANMAYLIEVDPETVGQFSGQLDKDNQEMYEGDLVEDVSYHDSIVCELRFENTGFWLKGNNDNVLFMPSQQYRKVVGNIHNNPVKEGI